MDNFDGYSHYETILEKEAAWLAWEQQRTRLTVAHWAHNHGLEKAETKALLEMLGLIKYVHGKRVPSKNLKRRAKKAQVLTSPS